LSGCVPGHWREVGDSDFAEAGLGFCGG